MSVIKETKAWSIFSIAAASVKQACVLTEVLLLLHAHFRQAIETAAAHMKYQKYLHLCFSLERDEREKNKGLRKEKTDRGCARKIKRQAEREKKTLGEEINRHNYQ